MDWNKAKNILILSFLILNILLFYELYKQYTNEHYIEEEGMNQRVKVENWLKENKIVVNSVITEEMPKMSYIYAQKKVSYKPQIIKTNSFIMLKEPGEYQYPKFVQEIEDSINDHNDNNSQNNSQIPYIYYQITQDGRPIFNSKITNYNLNELSEVPQEVSYFVLSSKSTEQQVISPWTALNSIIKLNKIEKNSFINSLSIGYYGQSGDEKIFVLTPVWRLVYNNKEVVYINAISNDLISENR